VFPSGMRRDDDEQSRFVEVMAHSTSNETSNVDVPVTGQSRSRDERTTNFPKWRKLTAKLIAPELIAICPKTRRQACGAGNGARCLVGCPIKRIVERPEGRITARDSIADPVPNGEGNIAILEVGLLSDMMRTRISVRGSTFSPSKWQRRIWALSDSEAHRGGKPAPISSTAQLYNDAASRQGDVALLTCTRQDRLQPGNQPPT